ncbi:uncharacterized protein LOC128547950 [Mercenaria mercenaria]|uniref:uncharacterized protein LOC128547950 n=1 Tax=Mercenaria mercenaria TaxID=6596 RepID=UPI00234F3ED6|nr:uncharacterized protein LOC128547950 [Mercenaria mercenaria]
MSKRKRTPNGSPSIEELTERLVPQVTTAVMKSLHDLGVLPRQQPVPVAASSQTSSTLDHTTGVSVPHPAITSTSTTGSFEASNGPGPSTFVDVHVTAPPEPADQSIQNIQGSCIIPASSSSQSDASATHTQELQLDQSTRQITIGAFSSLDATGSNTNLPSFNSLRTQIAFMRSFYLLSSTACRIYPSKDIRRVCRGSHKCDICLIVLHAA